MGKNDDSRRKRLKPAWQDIEESDKRIERWNAPITVYVQATHALYKPADILRLITAAKGKVVDTLVFANSGREQYKVEITKANLDALWEGWPVLAVSRYLPFKKTTNMGWRAFLSSKDCL